MIAQLTLFLDPSGQIRAEAPGLNGSRRKVDLPLGFAQANPEILAELISQLDADRERRKAALRSQQIENIQYVDRKHRDLARQIWHDPELIFSARYRKHLTGEAGNLASPTAAQRADSVKKKIALDLTGLDL